MKKRGRVNKFSALIGGGGNFSHSLLKEILLFSLQKILYAKDEVEKEEAARRAEVVNEFLKEYVEMKFEKNELVE